MADDGDGLAWAWVAVGAVAVLGTFGCAVVVADSFTSDRVSDGVAVAVCVGALPVLIVSAATLTGMRRRHRDVLREIERTAPSAWPLAGLLFVVFWIFAASGVAASDGDPRIRDGRYYLVNHGVYTEISADEYDRQEAAHQRIIAGGAGALYAPGISLGLYFSRR